MNIRAFSRPSAAALLLAALVTSGDAQAQTRQVDPRWQPWIGCWETDDEARPVSAGAVVTCVIPATGTSAVEILTVVDGRVASRERVDATGEQRPATKDGCTGWDRATWAADGRRVFLRSEYTCQGGQRRATSGMITMFADGQWLDVRGISGGENTGVGVIRYRDAGLPTTLPSEIASALPGWSREQGLARTAAVAPVDTRAIVEATRQVDLPVVEAWLAERRQGFALDAKKLVELADAGVPGRVIDVMVALSYPRAFAVAPAGELALAPGNARRGVAGTDGRDVIRQSSLGIDPFDYYSPYGYSRFGYGYSPYGYSRFGYGYSPYGYGYSPYGSTWYPGSTPVVIIRDPGASNRPTPANGQAVNGRGYTRTRTTDNSATPRAASSGSSSTGAAVHNPSPSSSGSSSGSSTGRSAKPKNP